MAYFGGFLGLIGLLTLIFRDGDVAGMPAALVGGVLLAVGVAFGAFGVVWRRRVRRRKIARGEPVPVGDIFQRARGCSGTSARARTPTCRRAGRSSGYWRSST
ncbi:hypothetical protein [Kribbella sp. NPDC049584]|uniref:hypothetical protein n=1 Tax=Kribbella sp. NPDC049584 TaxID=3154833 RepID=UPI003435A526